MNISFDYLNPGTAEDHNRNVREWGGCCCQCANRLIVTKQCCHSPREDTCVCSHPLGFYVCIAFYNMGEVRRAELMGKHGFCEMFVKTKIKAHKTPFVIRRLKEGWPIKQAIDYMKKQEVVK